MGILAIAQLQPPLELEHQALRPALRLGHLLGGEVTRHRSIIGGRVCKRLGSKPCALRLVRTVACSDGLEQPVVIGRVDHHGHVQVVLRRAAQHCRPTHIDVFDGVFARAAGLGNRLHKRIEVDHQQVYGWDTVLVHHGLIDTAATE